MIELFHQHFDKEWLDEVTALYDELIVNNIGCFKNQQFFRSPGNYRHSGVPYGGKRARHLAENEYNTHNKYLNFLVYSPSIQMLEYIIKNNITGIRVLDWGAGTAIFSVFLAKLGIKCINYDNLSQISKVHKHMKGHAHIMNFLKAVNDRFGYDIVYTNAEAILPNFDIDMITASGVPNVKITDRFSHVNHLLLDSYLTYDIDATRYTIKHMSMIDIYTRKEG
jgi:hypothetical protein